MSKYETVVDVFNEFDIRNETDLRKAIKSENYSFRVGDDTEPIPLGAAITNRLLDMDLTTSSNRLNWGIQQYSLLEGAWLSDELVKKSLFLSRRATIFTRHHFELHESVQDYTEDMPIYERDYHYQYSREFIFDLYKYREPIKRGELRIIPTSMTKQKRTIDAGFRDTTVSQDIPVLEELNKCNVTDIKAGSRFIEDLIKRYEKKEQFIHLPNMFIPWIRGIDIDDILRIKDEYKYSIDKFQSAYNLAITENIKNYQTVNFEQISKQIYQDIILQNLEEIDRKYQRHISKYRQLTIAGAVVSSIPIISAIVSQDLFNQEILTAVSSLLPPLASGLISTFGINRIKVRSDVENLEENDFYIIWAIDKDKIK